jgi:hypothetical protein
MAPLIRFSEKSLHRPKLRVAAQQGGFRTPTAREGSTRAYTVCNFGIRAADAGMVPTKPFFCRYLKGRITPRRGRGGTDSMQTRPAATSLRRPYGKRRGAQIHKLAEDRDGVWHGAGEAVVAQPAAQSDRANAPTRWPAHREARHGKYSLVSFVSESTPVGKGPVNKFESAALQQHRVTDTQTKLGQANEYRKRTK